MSDLRPGLWRQFENSILRAGEGVGGPWEVSRGHKEGYDGHGDWAGKPRDG